MRRKILKKIILVYFKRKQYFTFLYYYFLFLLHLFERKTINILFTILFILIV